jgi:hypothetical protein
VEALAVGHMQDAGEDSSPQAIMAPSEKDLPKCISALVTYSGKKIPMAKKKEQ